MWDESLGCVTNNNRDESRDAFWLLYMVSIEGVWLIPDSRGRSNMAISLFNGFSILINVSGKLAILI